MYLLLGFTLSTCVPLVELSRLLWGSMVVPSLVVPAVIGIGCVASLSKVIVFPVNVGTHSGLAVQLVVLVFAGIVCVLPPGFVFGCAGPGLTYRFHSDSVPCVTHSNFVQFGIHFLAHVGSLSALASL